MLPGVAFLSRGHLKASRAWSVSRPNPGTRIVLFCLGAVLRGRLGSSSSALKGPPGSPRKGRRLGPAKPARRWAGPSLDSGFGAFLRGRLAQAFIPSCPQTSGGQARAVLTVQCGRGWTVTVRGPAERPGDAQSGGPLHEPWAEGSKGRRGVLEGVDESGFRGGQGASQRPQRTLPEQQECPREVAPPPVTPHSQGTSDPPKNT